MTKIESFEQEWKGTLSLVSPCPPFRRSWATFCSANMLPEECDLTSTFHTVRSNTADLSGGWWQPGRILDVFFTPVFSCDLTFILNLVTSWPGKCSHGLPAFLRLTLAMVCIPLLLLLPPMQPPPLLLEPWNLLLEPFSRCLQGYLLCFLQKGLYVQGEKKAFGSLKYIEGIFT